MADGRDMGGAGSGKVDGASGWVALEAKGLGGAPDGKGAISNAEGDDGVVDGGVELP